jgi:CubicO group peptidase (beta-lactamase class C family)
MQLGLFGNAAFDPGAATADYPAIASPAGFVHLSIKDWARFVSLHLRADPANPHVQAALLSPRTFAALHGITSKATYSGGWYVGSRSWAKGDRVGDTGRVLYHVGDNGRWTSVVWLAPEIDFAVLVTCNRGDRSAAVDEVASRLVATYARVKVE